MRQPVPLGKYLLLDRISVGGMAEVFRAKNFGVEGFEKLVAIKRILPSMGEDREFIRMFVDEAKIAGQLSHPSICQIFELNRDGSSHYIAMEYVWGKDLLQIHNRFRKLKKVMPVTMACHILSKVCEGLDYAHRKRSPLGTPLRIVHRDCSPQNLLVSYDGEVKLIDFGIAKAASRVSHTNAGVLKGKFAYMSPEQVKGDRLDRRSDIFALGTVLYESVTGTRLFFGESDFGTLERVRNATVPRPRSVNPEIPEEVEAIILRALTRDPEARYQHASDMYRDLQQFLRSQEHAYTPSSLGAWLREAFAAELAREREVLERCRRIGPNGEIRDSAPPVAESSAEVLLESPSGAATGSGRHPAAGSRPENRPVAPPAPPAKPGGAAIPRPGGDFEDEGPTEVHGEIGSDPGAGDARPARAASPAPAAATGTADAAPPRRATSQPPPVPASARAASEDTPAPRRPTTGPTSRAPTGAIPREPTASVRYPVVKTPGPHRKPRPPRAVPLLVRDVGVGLLIAAVVLGLYAGGRRLLSDSGSPRLAAADTGPAGGAAPAQTPGVLVIDEATPRHGVRVDGEALDVDLTRDAIPLEPGREHAVEVVLGDRVVERFVITVDPAQAVRRAIEIESSERAPARDQGGRDSRRAATTEAAAAESAGDTPERRSGDSAQALPRSPR